MGIGRKIASVSAAAVLAGASLIAIGGQANAVASVTATSVDEGNGVTLSLRGCADDALYAGATVVIEDLGTGEKVNVTTAGDDQTFTSEPLGAGSARVTYTCVGYNGTPDSSATTTFTVYSTRLDISPNQWAPGETITITAEGYTAGETVSLKLTDVSSKTVVWTDAAVVAVNANGELRYSFVMKSDVPLGSYTLTATGDQSGKVRTAGFSWGAPDSPTTPPTTTPPTAGSPGLPSTGN